MNEEMDGDGNLANIEKLLDGKAVIAYEFSLLQLAQPTIPMAVRKASIGGTGGSGKKILTSTSKKLITKYTHGKNS